MMLGVIQTVRTLICLNKRRVSRESADILAVWPPCLIYLPCSNNSRSGEACDWMRSLPPVSLGKGYTLELVPGA